MVIFEDEKIIEDMKRKSGEFIFLKTDEVLENHWVIKKIEIMKSANPKFGAHEIDAMYKKGILELGETLRYTFEDDNGTNKFYENKGMAFYLGFKNGGIEDECKIKIDREGTGESTRYTVTKLED